MPTRLYVVRHLKSSWADEDMDDFDRPLSARGVRDGALMAAYLADRGLAPDVVLCSPAARTRATLTALAVRAAEVRFDDVLYGASYQELLDAIDALPNATGDAMVIAHNPGVADLVSRLAGDDLDMPTGAVATFESDERGYTFASLVTPKQLRD